MALLWIGPFYVVVMWTVVSSFLGSTWSAKSIYDGYLDNEIGTKNHMENQDDLRETQRSTFDDIGNYIYERFANKNSEPRLFITDVWDNVPESFPYRSGTSSDGEDSSQELWSKFPISPQDGKLSRSEALSDEMTMNKLIRLNDMPTKTTMEASKRQGHSLSIVNPLDVLRQRVMLDLARRKMKENQEQIKANDVILKNMGKRKKRSAVNGGQGRAILIWKRRLNQNTFDVPRTFDEDKSDEYANSMISSKALEMKRQSFSVVNALDVLDQQNQLRRKLKENEDKIRANTKILKSLGKKKSFSEEKENRRKSEV